MHLGDPNGSASGCMCWIKSTITLEMEVIGTTWKGVPWKIEEQLGGTIQHIIKVICKPEKKKKKKKDDKDFPPNIDADEYELNTYYAPSLGQPLALVLTRYKQCGECKKPPVPCEENKTDFTKPTGKPICDQTWPISGPALANNAMGDLWAMRHHLGTSPPPNQKQKNAAIESLLTFMLDVPGPCGGRKLPCSITMRFKDLGCKPAKLAPGDR